MVEESREYFTMIAWDGCPFCSRAYDLLRSKKKEVHVTYYERGSQQLQEAKQKNNWQTVPMITRHVFDGDTTQSTFIGGYDSLVATMTTEA